MKFIIALSFIALTHSTLANLVFMREWGNEKHIMLQDEQGVVSQITSSDHLVHLYPDISSDGKTIIYIEGTITDDGKQDLYIVTKNLVTNKTERWISPTIKGMLLHPRFSKNGEYIFFSGPAPKNKIFYFSPKAAREKNKNKNNEEVSIYSYNATALDLEDEGYFPRPSSDANFVVYQKNAKGFREIVLFDRIEGTKTVIDQGMAPALSFDERLIAYTSKKAGTWDIYEYNRETKVITRKTFDNAVDEMAPTYNTNNELVFASNKTGNFRLYKLVGDQWSAITETPNVDDYAPNFSGEGQFIQGIRAPFIEPMRSSFGTVMHQGLLYMCGGHQGPEHTYPKESFTDHFQVYDKRINVWRTLAPRPIKAHGYQLAAYGNYIYAFGGFTYSEDHTPKWKSVATIDRYDIINNTWTTIGNLSSPRSSNAAITIGEKVYLVGGWDSTPKFPKDYDGTFKREIDVFDLKTETITTAPYKMPDPLRRAFTGIEYNGQILLVGGLGVGATHFELIDHVTLMDPETGRVTELPKLPFATFAPAAQTIGDELFVFGGMFKTGEMNYEYVSHIYGFSFNDNIWRHTGRYLKETKGFSQVFQMDARTIGILGGHHYYMDEDRPVNTFEIFKK